MAKGKGSNAVQNRAIYSRLSFLQQAAVMLSTLGSSPSGGGNNDSQAAGGPTSSSHQPCLTGGNARVDKSLDALSRRLTTDLRAVSLKTRIRLEPAVKQTICKFCDSVLIEGQSCTSVVENRSKGARKPWADVLVRRCHTCGRQRRYPVSAPRPKRKTERDGVGRKQPLDREAERG
ncbi:hypothetical protein VTJ83DRAFT_1692 [Remersonia thermophila]|uniref:Uncharacterized protein n=1 Tax=Remersonia thermophila TaxID=72144 RepID=A0ABR4DGM7_9PEZI